uniref:BAR domain-containing protein n=1 Tax=Panagrellus redivivus TaxID=6233 RepID=A0A7E4ZSP8_PANRE
MFNLKRLKQTVKEKTGTAMMTRYPAEVDQGITMTTEMLKGIKAIDMAIMAQWANYRLSSLTKLEKISNLCLKIAAKKNEKKVGKMCGVTANLCTAISKAERNCAKDIARDLSSGFSKRMISGELKAAVKLIDDLKKRRLDKDAANNEEGAPDAAEKDAAYESQLALVQAEFANLPAYQTRHAAAIKKFLTTRMAALAEIEKACNDAKPGLV